MSTSRSGAALFREGQGTVDTQFAESLARCTCPGCQPARRARKGITWKPRAQTNLDHGGKRGVADRHRPGARLLDDDLTNGRVTALDHADFDLYPGEILAVIGDNGAGKSSLIKALCGAVVPNSGEIRLAGQAVHFTPDRRARSGNRNRLPEPRALARIVDRGQHVLGREIRSTRLIGRVLWSSRPRRYAKVRAR